MKSKIKNELLAQLATRTASIVKRGDGWENSLTGLGTLGRDKLMSSRFRASSMLSPQELENMYHGDDIVARIVDKPVEDALRQGFDVRIKNDKDDEEADPTEAREKEESILSALDDLGAMEKIGLAYCWGRLFGGAGIYAITDDPAMPDEELDLKSIRTIYSLAVFDRRDMYPIEWDNDPTSKHFGEPLIFQVTPMTAPGPIMSTRQFSQTIRIHASRLILFGGTKATMRQKLHNSGWSPSVIQQPYAVLQAFNTAYQAAGHIMTDASQGVYKMSGLLDALSSNKQVVLDRMAVVDMARGINRMMLIDAEVEDFSRQDSHFTGMDAMIEKWQQRMAAAAKMPLTVLMGQSPAGLNATGESDQDNWDDVVRAEQTHVLKPRLERLIEMVMASKDGPIGSVPDDWCVEFKPLRQMNPKETAELRKMIAETDAIMINAQVVTPEEVAISRYGEMGYSPEMHINLELRKDIQEIDDKKALEDAKNPPEPVVGGVDAKGNPLPAGGKPIPSPAAE